MQMQAQGDKAGQACGNGSCLSESARAAMTTRHGHSTQTADIPVSQLWRQKSKIKIQAELVSGEVSVSRLERERERDTEIQLKQVSSGVSSFSYENTNLIRSEPYSYALT